ncbi:unnamed protein product [Sphagnum compactum]
MVMCGTGCHEVEDYSSSSAQRSPRGERSPSPREQRSPSPKEQRSPSPERGGGGGGSSSSDAIVACFGELLIDFVPTIGGLSLAGAPAFKKAPGGAPANVACGIAKLGSTAAFLGKVGDDEFGYMLVDVLKDNHVETKGVRFDPTARTALAFVTLQENGEREFMFYRNPSADMLYSIGDIDVDLIQKAKILHYGSISLITEPSRSAHMEILKIAKKAGLVLSYDPNLRLPLWPSADAARQGIKTIWDQAEIIKVSDEEVTFLTNGGDPNNDAVNMTMFHKKLRLLLVTTGPEGCRYYTKNFKGTVPGIKVNVVDTTGAGDAFCAGYLTKLVEDMKMIENEEKLREALKFACVCGAITTTERGAIPALPDRSTVMKLLESQNHPLTNSFIAFFVSLMKCLWQKAR